ncbi:MAG: hypothetical protein KDC48_05740, partial [Planctomycetes bacterium]|nr:hypothetical protein [Planctomycetota bacterium]
MIVVLILAVLVGILVPQYRGALTVARLRKAEQELITIAQAIDAYSARNEGHFPLTLFQVGFGGKRDPWGVPYCYFNYEDGTGDGLEWAVGAGLVDPDAIAASAPPPAETVAPTGTGNGNGNGSGSGNGNGNAGAGAGAGTGTGATSGTAGIATVNSNGNASAMADARTMQVGNAVSALNSRQLSKQELDSLRSTLSSTPSAQFFTGIPAEQTRRRDRFLFPVNSDYDLFSL